MTLDQENAIYDAQDEWIREHCPDAATNIGWAVDEIEGVISTKIYGLGVLTTDVHLNHTFEPFREEEI